MALSLRDLLGQKEFWIFLFAAGWVLLNWPLINLAEGFVWMGVPAILIYIASIWLLLILALYLFDRRSFE
jgi:hypothetical protein